MKLTKRRARDTVITVFGLQCTAALAFTTETQSKKRHQKKRKQGRDTLPCGPAVFKSLILPLEISLLSVSVVNPPYDNNYSDVAKEFQTVD